eukprot:TRINITY_DN47578_c0_g1_i1.p1 TRINITY_DN47578_c0_g1~~TRINITY_DN47578_c0_g1_i1.p1  ORF type:complete len:787 (-),score=146.10 TRINITY_DN47578_c0_g1_i1:284-2644(-)
MTRHQLLRRSAFALHPPAPDVPTAKVSPLKFLLGRFHPAPSNEESHARLTVPSNFPDFIDHWSPTKFRRFGTTAALCCPPLLYLSPVTGVIWTGLTAAYWAIGLQDLAQREHSVRRNFPVLGNLRYIMETLRPEIQQYFVERDTDDVPFSRERRALIYRRAKGASDTIPFGSKRPAYDVGYEWLDHSAFPTSVSAASLRVPIGAHSVAFCSNQTMDRSEMPCEQGLSKGEHKHHVAAPLGTADPRTAASAVSGSGPSGSAMPGVSTRDSEDRDVEGMGTAAQGDASREWAATDGGLHRGHRHGPADGVRDGSAWCSQAYSASLLNISAMSYGAMSSQAIEAYARGCGQARYPFYFNTGEGGFAPIHDVAGEHGAHIVFQLGTGYFGARTARGGLDDAKLRDVMSRPHVKMLEIKLSQGAKPGHGGILPKAKLTEEIARVRGVPMGHDVHSPAGHSEFNTGRQLGEFLRRVRACSHGKPVGVKLCVGDVISTLRLIAGFVETGSAPDFITVDGAEGGTGAAPVEFANSIGRPMLDGLSFVHTALVGCGLRAGHAHGVGGMHVSVDHRDCQGVHISTDDVLNGNGGSANSDTVSAATRAVMTRTMAAKGCLSHGRLVGPHDDAVAEEHVFHPQARVRLIASGKVTSGITVVRALMAGADMVNSARAFMMAVGCIQSLKCNTNRCPVGVATQDPLLSEALDPVEKGRRVARFHASTMHSVAEILGAAGVGSAAELRPHMLHRRTSVAEALSYEAIYFREPVVHGALLVGTGPPGLQAAWDHAVSLERRA